MNKLEVNEVEIKLYKKRWFVLALLACLIFQMIFVYMNFGFLNIILVLYFNTTYAAVDWLYLGWNIGTTVAALATSWLAVKKILTCRRSMIVASILQAINSFFIIFGFLLHKLFFLLILGQVIGGISAAVLWTVPTSLAQLWFPESQIGLATGTALLGSSSAALVAYLLPAHIMKFPTNTTGFYDNVTATSWMEYDGKVYKWLFFVLLTISLSVLIFLLFAVPEQPEKPPSYAQHLKRVENIQEKITFENYTSEIKKLVCDYAFIFCGIASSLMYYLPVLFSLSMELMVTHISPNDILFVPETISAYVLSLLTLGCCIGNIAGGFIVDKFKGYHLQSTLGATFSLLFTVALLLSVYFRTLIALILVIFVVGIFTRIAYLSLIDSLMQHTYPADPVFVMPFLVFIQNIIIFLVILVNRQITYSSGLFGGLGFVCTALFLAALICLIFKTKIKRLSAENSNALNNPSATTPLVFK